MGKGLLVSVLVLGLVLMGCDGGGNDSPYRLPVVELEAEYDVIVVGSGIAGTMAAFAANDEGLSVLLIEMDPTLFGGNTRTGGGVFSQMPWNFTGAVGQYWTGAWNNTHVVYQSWWAATHNDRLRRVVGSNTLVQSPTRSLYPNMERVMGIIAEAPALIRYLRSLTYHNPDAPTRSWSFFNRNSPRLGVATTGAANLMNDLQYVANAREGITVAMGTTAKRIHTQNGVVRGVEMQLPDGTRQTIGSYKVIMATGGFAGCTELIDRWSENFPGMRTFVPSANQIRYTGKLHYNGIVMVLRAGGRFSTVCGTQGHYNPGARSLIHGIPSATLYNSNAGLRGINNANPAGGNPFATGQLTNRDNRMRSVVVNAQGERIISEYIRTSPPATTGQGCLANALLTSGQAAPWWMIFDSNPNNPEALTTLLNNLAGNDHAAAGAANVIGIGANAVQAGAGFATGMTIGELATSMRVPVEALEATITRYNSFAIENPVRPLLPVDQPTDGAAGSAGNEASANVWMGINFGWQFINEADVQREPDFNKPLYYVRPIATPPFFAVQMGISPGGPNGTIGGIVTGLQGQVLNLDGNPIPNLFAVGEMANRSHFGEAQVGGSSYTFYGVMGLRAGREVARLLND